MSVVICFSFSPPKYLNPEEKHSGERLYVCEECHYIIFTIPPPELCYVKEDDVTYFNGKSELS